jgi:glycosyltransferase involved in cell wall biosynthesis
MIYILWTTARPDVFRKTYAHWYATAENPANYQLRIAVDTIEQAQQLHDFPFVQITLPKTHGCGWPFFCLTNNLNPKDDDIIVLASDDMFPPPRWDKFLKAQLDGNAKVLIVNDGIQFGEVATLPILNGKAFKKLNGVVYHPSFKHLYIDTDFYARAKALGLIEDVRKKYRNIIFEHRHYSAGKRPKDIVDSNIQGYEGTDKLMFEARQKMPIEKRLEVDKSEIFLSILILSIPLREKQLTELLKCLEPQRHPNVEILVDNRKRLTIGKKRSDLLEKAQGKYIAFIDDDDKVHPYYVSTILNAIKDSPDVVGITGLMTTGAQPPKQFIHSIKYNKWFEKDGIYYRPPNHLNPVLRGLALKIKYDPINHGEDRIYSDKLFPSLRSEVYINNPIYWYRK